MAEDLGTIRGSIVLDVSDAIDSYTKARQEHLSTVSALGAGAGAFTQVGASFVAVGASAAAGLLVAMNAAAEFERKLDYFIAVSGPESADMYDEIAQKALQLGADTIYSADQIADSFVELGKSGVSAKDIIDGIGEGVAALGAAADIPLDTAANIITAAVQTFQLGAENAVKVADMLAGAANSSVVDVQDLGVSLKYVGGVASSLGVSFEETNTALGLLGKFGIRGSTAGTSLRQTLLSLNGTTKKSRDALKELGIITEDGTNRFYDQNGSAKSLAEIFQILQDATRGYSDEQRTATLQQIFATRALPTVNALMREGAAGFEEMAAAIAKVSAADVAAARLDNLSGDIEVLRGNFDTLLISIGMTQQALGRSLVQGITAVVNWLNQLDPAWLGLIAGMAQFFAVTMILIGGLGLLSGALLNIIGLAQRLGPAIAFLVKIIPGLTFVIARLKAILLFPGTPIIAVILAIAAALYFFFTQTEQGQKVWAQFIAFFQQTMATLTPILTQLATTLGGVLLSALQAVLPIIAAVANFFATTFAPIIPIITQGLAGLAAAFSGVEGSTANLSGIISIFTSLASAIAAAIPIIVTTITQVILTIIQIIVGAAPTLIAAGITMLTGLIQGFVSILPQIITAVVTLITQLVTTLVGMLPTLIAGALTLFTGIIQAVSIIMPLLINGALQLVVGIITALVQAIPLLIEAALQLFMTLIDAIPVILPLLIEGVVLLITGILEALVEALPMILEAAITMFMSLIEAVFEIAPKLITTIIELIPTVIGALLSMIPILLDAAIKLFTALIDALPRILPALINGVVALIPKIISTLLNMIPQLIGAAVQLFMAIVQAIPKIVPKVVDALISLGTQMIQGLIQGIGNMASAVIDSVTNVIGGAVDWAKDLLNINSPSRVFRDIGINTILGMIVGMERMQPSLERTFGMVGDSVDSFYDQVYAAREMDMMVNLATQMGVTDRSTESQLAALNEQLAAIAEKDTINIEKIENNYPEPEPSSDNLPTNLRKAAHIIGVG